MVGSVPTEELTYAVPEGAMSRNLFWFAALVLAATVGCDTPTEDESAPTPPTVSGDLGRDDAATTLPTGNQPADSPNDPPANAGTPTTTCEEDDPGFEPGETLQCDGFGEFTCQFELNSETCRAACPPNIWDSSLQELQESCWVVY